MSAPKHYNKHGVLLGVEASYGSDSPALAGATDGLLVADSFDWESGYQDDGAREGRSSGGYASIANTLATGQWLALDLPPHFFRGSRATPYSASVFSTVHNILRALGMSATFSATPTPNWVYKLISDAYPSLHGQFFSAKEQVNARGIYATKLAIEAKGVVVPKWMASIKGILSALEADAAVPAITYPYLTNDSPKATNVGLTLTRSAQNFLGKVEEFSLSIDRPSEDLTDQNDSTSFNHGGLQPGIPEVTLDFVLRSTLLAANPYITATTIDPFQGFGNGFIYALAMTIGSLQYNRWKASGSLQLKERPKRRRVGQAMFWEMSTRFVPPDDAAELDFAITTD